MPIIGAAYLRCSDPRQDKSIEQQRQEISRRTEADGVVIPPENWFIDEGLSGRSTRRWASYLGLIRRAEAQREAMRRRGRSPSTKEPIARLYVWAISRIARNMFDCLRALATLDDAGIEIVSLTEQDTGDASMRKLIRPILAWLAERYSEGYPPACSVECDPRRRKVDGSMAALLGATRSRTVGCWSPTELARGSMQSSASSGWPTRTVTGPRASRPG